MRKIVNSLMLALTLALLASSLIAETVNIQLATNSYVNRVAVSNTVDTVMTTNYLTKHVQIYNADTTNTVYAHFGNGDVNVTDIGTQDLAVPPGYAQDIDIAVYRVAMRSTGGTANIKIMILW